MRGTLHSWRRAFTLVELLVVLAVIGILIGLTFPAVQSARSAARRTQCTNRIRQLAMAHINYESSHEHFPRHKSHNHSVFVNLLPFVDERPLSDKANLSSFPSDELADNCPEVYRCPSEVITGKASYKNYFINEPPKLHSAEPMVTSYDVRPSDLWMGLSNTSIYSEAKLYEFGEGHENAIFREAKFEFTKNMTLREMLEIYRYETDKAASPLKSKPTGLYDSAMARNDWCFGPQGYNHYQLPNRAAGYHETCIPLLKPASSYHPGGVNVAFADGHVQFISSDIDYSAWLQMGAHRDIAPLETTLCVEHLRPKYLSIFHDESRGLWVKAGTILIRVLFKKYESGKWKFYDITEPIEVVGGGFV